MGTLGEKQLILPILPVPHKVDYQDGGNKSHFSVFCAEKREAEQWPYTGFCFLFIYFILFCFAIIIKASSTFYVNTFVGNIIKASNTFYVNF